MKHPANRTRELIILRLFRVSIQLGKPP